MTQLDIHPEHLMDRVLSGRAHEQERGELLLHLRTCRDCAAEWQLAQVLRDSERPVPAHTLKPMVNGALEVLARKGRFSGDLAGSHPASVRPAARMWLPWAAALCLFFTGSAAAATMIMVLRSETPAVERSTPPRKHAPQRVQARAEPPKAPPIAEAPMLELEPELELDPEFEPEVLRTTRRPKHAARHGSVLSVPAESASSLFAKARSAASAGDARGAATLYKRLQTQFPKSSEAQVSRVTLGRLYLERLSDSQAALVQFDRYLARGGSNAPEALLGRARALRALGRTDDEAQTLRMLVARYPDSLYVTSAKQRLGTLE